MEVSKEQVRVLSEMQGLCVPDDELEQVATRMSIWLTAFEQIEEELGEQMNKVDPIPPVLPHGEIS